MAEDWRSAYEQLLKRLRAMQERIDAAEARARAPRRRAANARESLQRIRTERRASDRFSSADSTGSRAPRNRRKND